MNDEGNIQNYCREVRRYLHRCPELSFCEEKTAKYIREQLEALQISNWPVAETGAYAVLDSGRSGPVVAIRADIDALPIQEENDLPYASVIPGRMHACGHDGHTAILLGLAKVLKNNDQLINGKIILVFQPAEESPPGGALKIIKSGILDEAQVMLGLHLNPQLPCGKIGVHEGPFLASVDKFTVKITGCGGHAAMPHLSVNPIFIGAQLVNVWQTIIACRVDPLESAALTVGEFNAGSSFNTIPNSIKISGTVRTLSEEVRLEIEKEFMQITKKFCQGLGGTVNINYEKSYPVLSADRKISNIIKKVGNSVLGDGSSIDMKPVLSGDDFAYYSSVIPSGFFFLGAGYAENNKTVYPFHHPRFNFNEEAMSVGVRVLLGVLRDLGCMDI